MRGCGRGARVLRGAAGALLASLALAAPLAAQPDAAPSGRDIMTRVDERPRGRDQTMRAVWRIVSGSGDARVRATRVFWRDQRQLAKGLHSQRLIVFESPPDVKDTAFLTWSRLDPAADDDQWIYLPALRKVRRIAAGDQGSSFVGTDFLYFDLAERAVDEDEHTLLREEEIEGARHFVVESKPKNGGAPYSKRVLWVNADTLNVTRVDFHARSGELEKTLTVQWQQVQGIWSWKRLEMESRRRAQRTIVELDQIEYDTGLGDDVFSESALRRGGR